MNAPTSGTQKLSPSWAEFAKQARVCRIWASPFQSGVAYLGTFRADGSPRVHPVTPIIGEQLFLFMEPTSPKRKDLIRDPRYTLHCAVEDSSGGGGEFYVRGRGMLIDDPLLREQAVRASSYVPQDHYIVFLFTIEYTFYEYVREWQSQPPPLASKGLILLLCVVVLVSDRVCKRMFSEFGNLTASTRWSVCFGSL